MVRSTCVAGGVYVGPQEPEDGLLGLVDGGVFLLAEPPVEGCPLRGHPVVRVAAAVVVDVEKPVLAQVVAGPAVEALPGPALFAAERIRQQPPIESARRKRRSPLPARCASTISPNRWE
jgi:hypothetical protein